MNQIRLTETQAVILTAACARDDANIFPVSPRLKGGAVGNVCKSLLKRGLIEETPAQDPDTVWRHDEEAGPLTLRATPLAFSVLGITDGPNGDDADADAKPTSSKPKPVRKATTASRNRKGREGTKQARLIEMLRSPDGATVAEIVAETGWQAHTVRGAISGTLKKKLGLAVETEKVEPRGRIYKITG